MNRTQATRQGATGLVVEGIDATVTQFNLRARTIPLEAGAVCVKAAADAAAVQRLLVPIDDGDLLDSITSDRKPTMDGRSVYADAGPDPSANKGAFKGPLIEHGTVKMSPQEFVAPSEFEVSPSFEKALAALAR